MRIRAPQHLEGLKSSCSTRACEGGLFRWWSGSAWPSFVRNRAEASGLGCRMALSCPFVGKIAALYTGKCGPC